MELVKNIFFNTDKIVEGATVKISYVGSLYQNGSNSVYMHYGYGEGWDDTNEAKMIKTQLGFQTEITLPEGYETLNLCYRNENGEWDNNCGKNFIFNIEKEDLVDVVNDNVETALTLTSENGMSMHKGLRKSYIWSKKIKLAVYKIIHYVPKILSGNYKRKINEQ